VYYNNDNHLLDGTWINIQSAEEFKSQGRSRVSKGAYSGPGDYFKLNYAQPCPRGCCYDNVTELLSKEEATKRINETIEELQYLLPQEEEEEESVSEIHNWSEEGF